MFTQCKEGEFKNSKTPNRRIQFPVDAFSKVNVTPFCKLRFRTMFLKLSLNVKWADIKLPLLLRYNYGA